MRPYLSNNNTHLLVVLIQNILFHEDSGAHTLDETLPLILVSPKLKKLSCCDAFCAIYC